jgi:hypothetical protein
MTLEQDIDVIDPALPQSDRRHLSHDAAVMLLAVLPEHIRNAYVNHAKEIGYSIEMVVEMALANFLDPESLTFTDCKPQIGTSSDEAQVA